MKILILGAGAMGSRYGAALSASDNEVWLYSTNKAHIDAVRNDGLRVNYKGEISEYKVNASTDLGEIPSPDLVLLFTKSTRSREALEKAKNLLNEKTMVLTLQNGIGNIETISEFVPMSNIIAGTTTCGSNIVSPGLVKCEGNGISTFGAVDPESSEAAAMAAQVAELLSSCGMRAKATENVMSVIWQKVVFSCAFNPIGFITELPQGAPAKAEGGRELAKKIIMEAVSVAEAEGVKVDAQAALGLADKVFDSGSKHNSSMLEDRQKGRLTEREGIMGNVVRLAEKHGIAVPALETVYTLVKIIEDAGRQE